VNRTSNMNTLLNFLKSFLPTLETEREREGAYLAAATDICDLERRMRDVDESGRRSWSPIAFGLYVR
jgi:Protein of unknown function (DUF3563)